MEITEERTLKRQAINEQEAKIQEINSSALEFSLFLFKRGKEIIGFGEKQDNILSLFLELWVSAIQSRLIQNEHLFCLL